jgi:hypothetical protein
MRTVKYLLLLITLITVVPIDTLSAIEPNQNETLDKIAVASEKTSINTQPTTLERTDMDEVANLLLAAFAALGTVLTWRAIRRETKQQQIKRTFQSKILSDLIRHMYRNKVCVCAVQQKLRDQGFDRYYPSEEHLLKLKLLPEDLRFDRFDNTPAFYDILHELELKFRNFNIEVDVSLEHLKLQNIGEETKIRDLEVLEFKSQLLTIDIINLMHTLGLPVLEESVHSGLERSPYVPAIKGAKEESELWRKFHPKIEAHYLESARKFLVSKSERYMKLHPVDHPMISLSTGSGDEKTRYFDDLLQLSDHLRRDIAGEYQKIHLIPFQ